MFCFTLPDPQFWKWVGTVGNAKISIFWRNESKIRNFQQSEFWAKQKKKKKKKGESKFPIEKIQSADYDRVGQVRGNKLIFNFDLIMKEKKM